MASLQYGRELPDQANSLLHHLASVVSSYSDLEKVRRRLGRTAGQRLTFPPAFPSDLLSPVGSLSTSAPSSNASTQPSWGP